MHLGKGQIHMLRKLNGILGKGDIYPLLEGACMLCAQDCSAEDFERVKNAIGGDVYDQWSEAGSLFGTYISGGKSYHASFHSRTGEMRVVEDAAENVAPVQAEEGSLAPLMTQGRLLYYAYDCGMLYTVRLADGRFIVIDGGMAEYEEPQHFLEILHSQSAPGKKPRIAAWFITHAHDDHFRLFIAACERFQGEIEIESVVYNWASPERYVRSSDLTRFSAIIASNPQIRRITPHTGMRFVYPGAEFRVLYTHEDRCPDKLVNFNDTSTVMRMESLGRRVMWSGDCMWETAAVLCKNYDTSVLRSEFLQVAHHGYSGGSDAFYRAVDAEVLIWPCPDFWYYTQGSLECNRYLSESPNVKAMFMSGREETVIDLTKPVVPSDPYAKYKNLKPGDVLLDEDFSGPTIYELCKTAITGGRTNYKSASLSLENGLKMVSDEERYCVFELMQPGMMADAPGFTLRLEGSAEKVGTAALFWNYDTPWEYSEEQALELHLEAGSEFTIELVADEKVGEAVLTSGETVLKIPYTPAQRRGLFIILKGSVIKLTHAKVIR